MKASLISQRLRLFLLIWMLVITGSIGYLVSIDPVWISDFSTYVSLFLASFFAYTFVLWRNRIFLSLISLFLLLFVIDVIFIFIEARTDYYSTQVQYFADPNPNTSHPTLTYWMKPDFESRFKEMIGNTVIYEDVIVHTDAMGRRGCPENIDASLKHAIFFGGSYTFGAGVQDNETMPCVFAQLAGEEFKVFNYGNNGYGPGQMYWILKEGELFEEQIPRAGIAVYSFIPDHVNRVVGVYSQLTSGLPYRNFYLFRLSADDGSLEAYRLNDTPGLSRRFQMLRIMREFSPAFRYFISNNHARLQPAETSIEIVVKLVLQSREYYLSRYDGTFIFLVWPRSTMEEDLYNMMLNQLRMAGVMVVEVPELPGEISAQIHPLDSHPSPAEYHWVAEYLQQFLAVAP